MLSINGEVRINIHNPLYILPPPPPLQMSTPPLIRQNAMTPEQWAEVNRLISQRKVFVPVTPVRVPAPSPAVIYEDSDDESTCTSEWDIEKGRF